MTFRALNVTGQLQLAPQTGTKTRKYITCDRDNGDTMLPLRCNYMVCRCSKAARKLLRQEAAHKVCWLSSMPSIYLPINDVIHFIPPGVLELCWWRSPAHTRWRQELHPGQVTSPAQGTHTIYSVIHTEGQFLALTLRPEAKKTELPLKHFIYAGDLHIKITMLLYKMFLGVCSFVDRTHLWHRFHFEMWG